MDETKLVDNITGRTIAITGAARGIGLATAEALLAVDVADPESFATFLDKARTDGGGHIDVLINNAGVMPVGPFLDHTEQTVRSAIEVNFYGVISGCRLALPDTVKRRRGHIVNIASMAGILAVPG